MPSGPHFDAWFRPQDDRPGSGLLRLAQRIDQLDGHDSVERIVLARVAHGHVRDEATLLRVEELKTHCFD